MFFFHLFYTYHKNPLHQNHFSSVDIGEMMNKMILPKENVMQNRIEEVYIKEKPRFVSRLRTAGKTLEEAEDFVHDVYMETMERLSILSEVTNLAAWVNALFSRRLIDAWRHE